MAKYRTLDGTFSALSHPARRQIMMRLRVGEATVSELAAPHRMSLPAFSKHIGVLEDAGLILKRKRGREHHCSLPQSPIREVDAWLRRFRDPDPTTTQTPNRKEPHG